MYDEAGMQARIVPFTVVNVGHGKSLITLQLACCGGSFLIEQRRSKERSLFEINMSIDQHTVHR